jgi:glucose/arabinose dehydrogenase
MRLLILLLALLPASLAAQGATGSRWSRPCGGVVDGVSVAAYPPYFGPLNDGRLPLDVVAESLPGNPVSLAFHPDGSLYVAVTYDLAYPLAAYSAFFGSVMRIADGEARVLVDGLRHPAGLLFVGNDLYVSQLGAIERLREVAGTSCQARDVVVDNLPFDSAHFTNGLAWHAGRVYASQGFALQWIAPWSRQELQGTVFSFLPDGSDLRVEVSGLRNTFDIAFDVRGGLWGADNGEDVDYDASGQETADELNLLVPGAAYGYPQCPVPACVSPVLDLGVSKGPAGIAWHAGRLFLCLWAVGEVLAFDPASGQLTRPFWNVNSPSDIVAGPDGALYVTEWTTHRVLRLPAPPAT